MNITADDLQAKILAATGPNGQKIIRRVVVAGQQILFSAPTHQQAFAGVKDSPGKGIAHLMLMLYDKSRPGQPGADQTQPPQTPPTGLINAQAQPADQAPEAAQPAQPAQASMPRGALIPASAILLANVAEFSTKAGIKPIDDSEFAKQIEEMSVILMDRFSPNFRSTVQQKLGGQPGMDNSASPAASGGIINNAGAQP